MDPEFGQIACTGGARILSLLMPFCIFITYLIGSIPFGFLLCKFFSDKDIRKIGSGNIGATNVLRTGNKPLALCTLILDGGKPILAYIAALFIIYDDPFCTDPDQFYACHCQFRHWGATGPWPIIELGIYFTLGCTLGHCFPIWLKFKGGKGVATAMGGLFVAVPYAGLAAAGAWIATALLFKISSLAALVAVGVAPIVTFFVYGAAPAVVCFLITLLVWFRHKDNIKRLLAGTEPRIGAK